MHLRPVDLHLEAYGHSPLHFYYCSASLTDCNID